MGLELDDQADFGFSNALALLCHRHFTIEEMKPRDLFARGEMLLKMTHWE